MFYRPMFLGVMLVIGTLCSNAQTGAAPANPAVRRNAVVQTPREDPVDVKIQQALRERDAIIRNLLERVQELENRLNVASVEAAPPSSAAPSTPSSSSSTTSESRLAAVVNNSTYDESALNTKSSNAIL